MLRTLALSGIVLLVCASAEAARVQVNLPYNVDIVREVGGTTTAGPGFGGLGLVTQEYAEANDTVDPNGLPNTGLFALPDGPLQLGPYSGNNAVRLTPTLGTAFISVTPAQYERLDVYVLAGDGTRLPAPGMPLVADSRPVNLQLIISHLSGPTGLASASVENFLADPVSVTRLVDGMDLTGALGAGFTDADDAAIFRYTFALNGLFSAPTDGITFRNNEALADPPLGPETPFGPNNRPLFILGATLDTAPVPEPSGLLFLATGLMILRRRRSRR